MAASILLALGACATVRLESPDNPVVIDVHVRIDLEENAKHLFES